jgi:hypothetical protein
MGCRRILTAVKLALPSSREKLEFKIVVRARSGGGANGCLAFPMPEGLKMFIQKKNGAFIERMSRPADGEAGGFDKMSEDMSNMSSDSAAVGLASPLSD